MLIIFEHRASSPNAAKLLSLIKSYCPIGIAITLLRLIVLIRCRAAASAPHAKLPLPLLDGMPDRPDDAATVAVMENASGRPKRDCPIPALGPAMSPVPRWTGSPRDSPASSPCSPAAGGSRRKRYTDC
jgi:hypothetical protein